MRHFYSFLLCILFFSCSKPPIVSQAPTLQDGERLITLNGVKHWVKVEGSKHGTIPLVIVHGGPGGNHYVFERTAGPELEKFATVVYYEQRGSGRSQAPTNPDDYALPTLIQDLKALQDSLAAPKITLLGYSFGAELSLRYAVAYPEKVDQLILSSPAELSPANMLVQIQGFYSIGDAAFRTAIENVLKDTTTLTQKYNKVWGLANGATVDKFLFVDAAKAQLNRQLWQQSKLNNTGLLAKVYLKNNKADLLELAKGLRTPTLLISGLHDKNGGLHTALGLKSILPNSTHKIYEQSAHFPDIEEPARFAQEVKSFLRNR
ncbi:alpha/beta fold hydrolase [Nibribacter ruber]|uniref:Alpha/beta fold hydrolase n=1 Tax=Nibribacter ruber TaxID=2698458 RepID=A0A6P1NSM5_9BACT|nr:alpha/beta hydrolase [Nibribacter ruber]QHL86846.1 alpha/beta fold hydrolase [Nibribacter ruber]